MGIDPVTHQPLNQQPSPVPSQSIVTAESRSDDQLHFHEHEGQVPSSENTSPAAEATSDSDSTDALLSSLWEDSTSGLLDDIWQLTTSEDNYDSAGAGQMPWDNNEGICEWLLDYQDFIVADVESENLDGERSTSGLSSR